MSDQQIGQLKAALADLSGRVYALEQQIKPGATRSPASTETAQAVAPAAPIRRRDSY